MPEVVEKPRTRSRPADNVEDLVPTSRVAQLLSLTKTGIDSLLENDPTFPRPHRLGSRTLRWKVSEIRAWLETRRG